MKAKEERPMLSDRVRRLKEVLIEGPPRFDAERCTFLGEVYKEDGGEPTPIKRARLFERICNEKTIYIDDNLLVGTQTRYPAGLYFYPEIIAKWAKKEKSFYCHLGEVAYTEEDREIIDETADYWGQRCSFSRAQKIFSEIHKDKPSIVQMVKSGVFNQINSYPQGALMPDWPKIMNKGMNGIIAEVEEELAKLPTGSQEALRKRYFYQSLLVCLNALNSFARRYAILAREISRKEVDPKRKEELEKIAEVCDWVPANPPRNFYEALQTITFVIIGSWIETGPVSICPSRMNWYLHPFYKKDKEDGKITREEAIEFLGCFFIKMLEGGLFVAELAYKSNSGQPAHVITLGGQTADGQDGTNEMDWLLLETQMGLRVVQPTFQLLYHDKMSEEFLLKALECIRDTGLGQPAFFNNDIAVQRHLYHWKPSMEDARLVGHAGCIQTLIPGRTQGGWEGQFFMPKILELALNNGKDPITGVQLGPETGEIEAFNSYGELHEAVHKQLQYFLPILRHFDELSLAIQAEIFPLPFLSAFLDDCIKTGKDIMDGGVRYNILGNEVIGAVDLANSMAAIKKLVFEDKKITMKELKAALDANFEGDGYNEIRHMCLDAPKVGNDDDYVDLIAREWYATYEEEHQKVPNYLGRAAVPHAWSVTGHISGGLLCGALPDGRKAGMPFTDASVSATPGTDKSGPTALVKSAVKLIDTVKYNSNHMNMKFHPSALEGREGLRKLLALIKTYMDLGGSHVQFNCVNGETLKGAQLHPEDYRDLVVRVAGFSAFFVHLDKGLQDEIIRRTELKFD